VDADSIIINPLIPLEVFLPPYDFDYVHFVGNKDHNGLNTGTFFLRVHEWSVRMLAQTVAYPMFRPEVDLGFSADQEAMKLVFKEPAFRHGVLYQPRPWYNTYEFHHGYEGNKGDLLVHFPGLEQDRWEHMSNWLDIVELRPHEWEMELDKTLYLEKIGNFWGLLREARLTLRVAEDYVSKPENVGGEMEGAIAQLRKVLEEEADLSASVNNALDRLKEAGRGRIDRDSNAPQL
jgi:hypothetical protein